jgi:hypothetical protein
LGLLLLLLLSSHFGAAAAAAAAVFTLWGCMCCFHAQRCESCGLQLLKISKAAVLPGTVRDWLQRLLCQKLPQQDDCLSQHGLPVNLP